MLRHACLVLGLFLLPWCWSAFAIENDAELPVNIDEYRLSTGDKIRIQVYNEDDLYLETTVNDSGVITYPLLGIITVEDKTPGQIKDFITNKLKGDYLIDPKVSVDIVEYRQFYVNGEVKNPGGFAFQPGMTVRKAISVAGGFRERASKEKIFIIREHNPDTSNKVGLDDKIRPGDIITVEESFF